MKELVVGCGPSGLKWAKKTSYRIAIDTEYTTQPHIQMDARNLGFVSSSFFSVYCDFLFNGILLQQPAHKNITHNTNIMFDLNPLLRAENISTIITLLNEFNRILISGGILRIIDTFNNTSFMLELARKIGMEEIKESSITSDDLDRSANLKYQIDQGNRIKALNFYK